MHPNVEDGATDSVESLFDFVNMNNNGTTNFLFDMEGQFSLTLTPPITFDKDHVCVIGSFGAEKAIVRLDETQSIATAPSTDGN